jgi:WD40 repeat protein
MSYEYQVGGSLKLSSTCYVTRQADEELFQTLLDGEICYVFNARQMGKSSLQLRVSQRLAELNIRCATIDMTRIGGEQVTLEQWYRGVILNLLSSLDLVGAVQLKQRWQAWQDLPMLQRLSLLIEEILTVHLPNDRLVIFIDEVDSALNLGFSADDFFAFVRSCYNYRATDANYDRLTWALFGVTTPANLVQDKTRTPFNIGRQIQLRGFQIQESLPLAEGLTGFVDHPMVAMENILDWTNGQPLLTQKLCRLLIDTRDQADSVAIVDRVAHLVHTCIITNWQTQDQPEHLRTIRDRLLRNEQSASRLLSIYQEILHQGWVEVDNSVEQSELLLAGLVHLQNDQLRIHNSIYAIIFDQAWIDRELANLRPYSQVLNDWLLSGRSDESKLLRGKSLSQVQEWIQGKRLSDDDYQFISASQAHDQAEIQINLEAARLKAVEAQLQQERRSNRLQRILLVVGMITIVLTSVFGGVAYWNYDRAIASESQARVSEIRTLLASTKSQFLANHGLAGLLEAMRASVLAKQIAQLDVTDQSAVNDNLRQALLGIQEVNQLPHSGMIHSLRFSPDGQLIASGSADGMLQIWRSNGQLVKTIAAHQGTIHAVRFSADGQMIATGGEDATVKIWQPDGRLLRTIDDFQGGIWRLEFLDHESQIATVSMDRFIKLWTSEGKLLQAYGGRGNDQVEKAEGTATISLDAMMAAIGTHNHNIQLWRRNGFPFKQLKGHQSAIWGLQFSPDSQYLLSGSDDGVVKLWNRQGKLMRTLGKLAGSAEPLAFSQNSQLIAATGTGKRISVWQIDGDLFTQFETPDTYGMDLAFSPDAKILASGGGDRQIHLWRLQHPWTKSLLGHQAAIEEISFSPDAQMMMSISSDGVIKLWTPQGELVRTIEDTERTFISGMFDPHGKRLVTSTLAGYLEFRDLQGKLLRRVQAGLGSVAHIAFSPTDDLMATVGQDLQVHLWTTAGDLVKQFTAHDAVIIYAAFSPDGQKLITASSDQTAKLWDRDGNLITVLNGHTGRVMQATFSPDGNTIATASDDQTIRLWNLDGTLRQTIPAHDAGAWAVTFNPDGQIIASGSLDNQIKLWTIEGKLITTLTGHTSGIRDLKFTPDGHTLVSGSIDQTVRLWNIDRILHDDLLQSSCEWVEGYLNSHTDQHPEIQQECRSFQSDTAAIPNKMDNTRSSSEGTK